jgi:hypothetical protein
MAQELSVIVSDEDRARLQAIVCDRNRLLKHTQRARIVLLSAEKLPVLQGRHPGRGEPSGGVALAAANRLQPHRLRLLKRSTVEHAGEFG